VIDRLRIATRGSHLALAQSRYIQKRIDSISDAPYTELIIIKTAGDANQVLSLAEVSGGNERKGLFTKEIEDALLDGRADIAVHSYKDLPTQMVPGLRICSVPQRLESLDLLVFPKVKKASDRPPYIAQGSTIGTSSARRVAQLKHAFPGLNAVLLRGNVTTRMRKLLLPGGPDATLLSAAGVERLMSEGFFNSQSEDAVDIEALEMIPIPCEILVPAPAQGTLAVQCRDDDARALSLLGQIHDEELARMVSAERLILAELEGGCQLHLGTHMIKEQRARHKYYKMYMFLGQDATQNRRKASYQFVRTAASPESLSQGVLDEIMIKIPIILTGKKERSDELAKRYGTLSLPLIASQAIPPDPEVLDSIRKSDGAVAAFFSASGVEAAATFSEFRGDNLQLAAVSKRTASSVAKYLGRQPITGQATGAELAHLLVRETYGPIFAIQAETGRDEFSTILKDAGRDVVKVSLYKTVRLPVAPADFRKLPEKAHVFFASPSAFDAFLERVSLGLAESRTKMDPASWLRESKLRLCSIGTTTTDAMLEKNCVPYAQSEIPDLDLFIQEFGQ